MRTLTTILRYVLIATILLVIIGLGWWYFFLRSEESAVRATDLGRGAGTQAPLFGGFIGSTYENLVSNLSSLGGGAGGPSAEGAVLPRLWQITQAPVAGAGFVSSGQNEENVRFVERGTGYVLEADPETGTLMRLTNTLVPRVYEARVGANGVVVLRSVNETGAVVTNAGQATTTIAEGIEPTALALSTLPLNIRTFALNPSGDAALYLLQEADGRISITGSAWNGASAERIATLGIMGWHILWLADGRVILTQHAADNATSYAYELRGGVMSRLASGTGELALLPKSGSGAMLQSSGSFLSARAESGANLSALPVRTSADKCVWAPGGELIAYCAVPQTLPAFSLGSRLRGEAHTADAWWKLDIASGNAELLYTPTAASGLDVERPTMDRSGAYIVFMNARDKSLWLLRIAE